MLAGSEAARTDMELPMSALKDLVDAMLAAARRENPGVELSITLGEEALLLPVDDTTYVDERPDGSIRLWKNTHVYDGCEVHGVPGLLPNLVVVLVVADTERPASLNAPRYEGDLATGTFKRIP